MSKLKSVECLKCHRMMPYEQDICTNCGANLAGFKIHQNLAERINKPNYSKTIFGILGFIFMLIAIPFKILFLDMKRK